MTSTGGLGVRQHGADIHPESLAQGLQKLRVPTPGADRAPVNRLAHLHQTGRSHRPFCVVEIAARVFPIEAAMAESASCGTLEIIDEILVLYVDHDAGRQDLVPVLHDRLVAAIVAAELGEIVGKRLASRKEQREARDAGVEGITTHIDEAGVRQRQMNQPDKDKVERHFVDDPLGLGCARAHLRGVYFAELTNMIR